ncbi:MAG TPA: S9 family peptidase [Vicinamibacterales bacterium]|nr:S9 family peptidase [Vicinamibacterales bacterium]
MSRRLFSLTSACVVLLVLAFGSGVRSASQGWAPDDLLKVKRVGPVVPSPDGSRAAFVVSEAVMDDEKSEWLSHIHVAAGDGSDSLQLTQGDKSATHPRWSPDGKWIAFLSARGGEKEKTSLYRIRVGGGEAERLTHEKSNVTTFEWAPDGKSIAFVMPDPQTDEEEKAAKEKRDARVIDADEKLARLYVIPVEKVDGKRALQKLTTGTMHVTGLDWAPDGSTIVFSHQKTPKVFDQNDISVVAVSGTDPAEPKALAATAADESDPAFSPDGRLVAYSASDNPPTWAFTGWVHVVAAGGGSPRALAKTFDEQPAILGWSADGRSLYVQEVHGTVGRLSTLPVDGGSAKPISPTDVNVGGAMLNRGATAVGFAHSWSDKAPEAYVAKLQPFAATKISRVQNVPEAPLGTTEVVRWKAPDGLEIEGLLTYPAGYQKGRRVPLLVVVHGGPTGVFTQSFVGMPNPYPIPLFAARGYAVLRCNVRGSSGYGRKFRYANYQDWGGGDYRDIMSGVDHVISLGVADPERLGIMGWSYGGYMTSWVITQTKRFKAASVGAGVTNLMSFTGTADIPGFIPDYFGGEYWEVFDKWRARSAMFNVKGVTTPTLIQHGEDDRRVPVSQGYELYNALQRQRVPVKMVVYPRQPHGIQEPKLIKDTMERNLEWFDRWILGRSETNTAAR